jgi:hypothetical protein
VSLPKAEAGVEKPAKQPRVAALQAWDSVPGYETSANSEGTSIIQQQNCSSTFLGDMATAKNAASTKISVLGDQFAVHG